uniref:PAZ domain-containing protein n=1 Tax=Caenorhabditis tropicalis TaxID=1561998 RepID=A0A1I7TAD0_9PELO
MSPPPAPPVQVPPMAVPPEVPLELLANLAITSDHIAGNDDCVKRMRELNLPVGEKVYPGTKAPGQAGTEIDIQTNLFGINVVNHKEIYQYTVNIKADVSPTKEVVFTKKGNEDFIVTDRHKKCCAVFYYALHKYDNFFHGSTSTFVYDAQSMLFSTVNLFPGHRDGGTKTQNFAIDGAEVDHDDLKGLSCIKLEIYPTKNPSLRFSQEDIGRRSSDARIDSINRGYHQIIELALNQSCLTDSSRCVVFENGKLFFFKPLEEGFAKEDCTEVGDGKQMMPGIKKTVHFVEGPCGRGQNNPSVVIDGMKVAFHKEQLVIEKMKETTNPNGVCNGINDIERVRCTAVIKGLDCYSNYTGRVVHLKIEGIYHEGARTTRFELQDGKAISVFDYFRDKYNVVLQYPDANLIVCKVKGKENVYPMELLTITPNQRVKITQQTSAQSQKTTKESAVLPDVRQRLIMTGKAAAGIDTENEVLRGLGIQVMDEPLMVKGRQLPPVKLMGHQGSSILPRDGKWKIGRYTRPANAPNIWALYCVGTQNTRFNMQQLKAFGDEFVTMFKAKGVDLPPPAETQLVSVTDIEQKLNDAAGSDCKFVFLITDDSITSIHQKYKLIEKSRNMVVQDMKLSKALSVVTQQKRLTLENVINKTNVKLGGTNFTYLDSKNYLADNLVIGIGVSNPPPGTKFFLENKGALNPTVIGFANNSRNAQEFAGDFALGSPGQDTLAAVEDIVTELINEYKKSHNNRVPKRVMVYRSGASDGNHGSIMAHEIPLALSAVHSFSKDIQMVYIAVSKDHTFRFFRPNLHALTSSAAPASDSRGGPRGPANTGPKPWDLNIGPGLMLDSCVTNPACKQFFLNSHITLQGSAKTPLYTVLYDDTNAPMHALEEVTFSMCHLHQIVGLPTSLPTPLYVANEYAKRGRNLWNETTQSNPERRQEGAEREQLQKLTSSINYKSANMSACRITA